MTNTATATATALTLLAGLASSTACTLTVASDEDVGDADRDHRDDEPPSPVDDDAGDDATSLPIDDPSDTTLVIGVAPGIAPFVGGVGWSAITLNYPAYDCSGVALYQSSEPVLIDATFERFAAALDEQLDLQWVQLERDAPTMLWRVTAFDVDAPVETADLPGCYFW